MWQSSSTTSFCTFTSVPFRIVLTGRQQMNLLRNPSDQCYMQMLKFEIMLNIMYLNMISYNFWYFTWISEQINENIQNIWNIMHNFMHNILLSIIMFLETYFLHILWSLFLENFLRFSNKSMFPLFYDIQKERYSYKHESNKNKKCLSVGNIEILSVARLQHTPAYVEVWSFY